MLSVVLGDKLIALQMLGKHYELSYKHPGPGFCEVENCYVGQLKLILHFAN